MARRRTGEHLAGQHGLELPGGPRAASASRAQAGGGPSTPTLPRLERGARPAAAQPPHGGRLPLGGGQRDGDGSKLMGKGNSKE